MNKRCISQHSLILRLNANLKLHSSGLQSYYTLLEQRIYTLFSS